MKLSKKLIVSLFTVLFACSSLCADITIKITGGNEKNSAPAEKNTFGQSGPTLNKLEQPPRLEQVEGRIAVHGRNIYIETPRVSFRIITDERDPRMNYRTFERWDNEIVLIEGYTNRSRQEIEVTKVIRAPKPGPKPLEREQSLNTLPQKRDSVIDHLR